MGSGRDRLPRRRRCYTAAHKAARQAKRDADKRKQAEEQAREARRNFFAPHRGNQSIVEDQPDGGEVPAVATTATANNQAPGSIDTPTVIVTNNKEGFVELDCPDPIHNRNPATPEDTHEEVFADLDTMGDALSSDSEEESSTRMDTSSDSNDILGTGPMKLYLGKILGRLQYELSHRRFPITEKRWLLELLDENEYWIPKARAKWLCRQLNINFEVPNYYRDVYVWFPDIQGGQECMPSCCTCRKNSNVSVFGYTRHHPARYVVGLHTHYYVMSRRYVCSTCKDDHAQAMEGGTNTKAIQYTFMGWHDESLRLMPFEQKNRFPALLTHRAGIDRGVVHMLPALLDSGLGPDAISNLLLENHTRQHTNDMLVYQYRLLKQRAFGGTYDRMAPPMFSKFGDTSGYNAHVPTGDYLQFVFKKYTKLLRSHIERETKKNPCDQLSVDASRKVSKRLYRHNGVPIFESLQTGTNQYRQIRIQHFTVTDSHEQLRPALQAMKHTQAALGQSGPRIVFTDNPTRDADFYCQELESVSHTQAALDILSGEKNSSMVKEKGGTAQSEGNSDHGMNGQPTSLQDSDSATHGEAEQLLSGDSIWVESKTEKINSACVTLRGLLEEGSVLSLDLEWDVEKNPNGYYTGRQGKVAVMSIGYSLDGEWKVLLIQLREFWNESRQLPEHLRALLDGNVSDFTFCGCNIKADMKKFDRDFSSDQWAQKNVRVEEIGMYARRRDVVQNAQISLADLVKVVLGQDMAKPDNIRCTTQWSNAKLTMPQKLYCAYDVIKVLEVRNKLSDLPDLSARLENQEPDAVVPGIKVDIVPPHCRRNPSAAARGYSVADLATRAAVGIIVPDDCVVYGPSFAPRRVRINPSKTRVVQISEVLARSLLLPGTKVQDEQQGNRMRNACLGDFEVDSTDGPPFKVVVPLSMLMQHVDSPMRVFGGTGRGLATTGSGVTPPAYSMNKSPASQVSTTIDLLGESDPEFGRLLGTTGTTSEEEELSTHEIDARKELTSEQMDHVNAASIRAERAMEDGGSKDYMTCSHLDAPPDTVLYAFSAVLGDAFHAMKRPQVDVKHEYKKPYYVALMRAWFQWDDNCFARVSGTLQKCGFSKKDIECMMYFNPSFFSQRVERKVLPPPQLYWRVRAVYIEFGNMVDSKTNRPLFNKDAWSKANNVLREIVKGYYSDPPGYDNFYTFRLDSKGTTMKDKYGIELIDCCRGTNDVENAHRLYKKAFSNSMAGIEYGSCLMLHRMHRHNIRMGRKYIQDYPFVGHYDTWKLDLLQRLVEKNHGNVFMPGHLRASDYQDTDESFQSVAIHDEELHSAVCAIQLPGDANLSREQKFLCRSQGVPIPFLPLSGRDEFSLFTKLMQDFKGFASEGKGSFEARKMALEWTKHVDSKSVFPKLPVYLREYRKRWERNRRVQDAVTRMKPRVQILDACNRQHIPSELVNRSTTGDASSTETAAVPTHDSDPGDSWISWPRAQVPTALFFPAQQALRSPEEGSPYVANDPTGVIYGLPDVLVIGNKRRKKGQRGGDKRTRRRRHCRRCTRYGGSSAEKCPGRSKLGESNCQFFDETGNRMNHPC